MPSSVKNKKKLSKKDLPKSTLFIRIGLALIFIALLFFIITFFPALKAELGYFFSSKKSLPVIISSEKANGDFIKPVSEGFGIVIPKIRANAAVVANVSPFNEHEYQIALTKGVAQARDTSLPGQIGNIFIFAHSAGDFYNASRYNAIFYLLNKLEKNDQVYLIYKGKKYQYAIREKKLVEADKLQYLKTTNYKKSLTLMTCWPPGTTLKRLLLIAEQVSP